jgi:AraC family transcriptional regulator
MILTAFPQLNWLKREAEHGFNSGRDWKGDRLKHDGWPSVVLNVASQATHRDNIRGPLSFFANLRGESAVTVDGRGNRIKEGFFFLSNQGQYYTLDIEKPVETMNVHVGPYFADQVLQSFSARVDTLLDNHFQRPEVSVAFHNRVGIRTAEINHILERLKIHDDPVRVDEYLVALMEILLFQENHIRNQRESLPLLKYSTKAEVFKRLSISVDYIYSNFDRPISLDELAVVCCLSKFHYLRLFKIAYGKTPGKFVEHVRLEFAKANLKSGKIGIKKLAQQLGYKDASTFSRTFRQHVGVYPTEFAGSVSSFRRVPE